MSEKKSCAPRHDHQNDHKAWTEEFLNSIEFATPWGYSADFQFFV